MSDRALSHVVTAQFESAARLNPSQTPNADAFAHLFLQPHRWSKVMFVNTQPRRIAALKTTAMGVPSAPSCTCTLRTLPHLASTFRLLQAASLISSGLQIQETL